MQYSSSSVLFQCPPQVTRLLNLPRAGLPGTPESVVRLQGCQARSHHPVCPVTYGAQSYAVHSGGHGRLPLCVHSLPGQVSLSVLGSTVRATQRKVCTHSCSKFSVYFISVTEIVPPTLNTSVTGNVLLYMCRSLKCNGSGN